MKIHNNTQRGFSYIDVLIGLVILLVGILGCVGAIAANLLRSYEAEKLVVAKQQALSAIESIFSVREIQRPGDKDFILRWQSIGNVGSNPVAGVNQGLFVIGFTPIREDDGEDGIIGTADDACPATGPCVVGTYTNSSTVLQGYERRIVITDVQDPERPSPPNEIAFRRVEVTIRYQINGMFREYTTATMITNYQ